jgi:holin-like protein
MIASLGLILVCQLLGEVVVRGLALPLPGPVLGLVLLLAMLLLRDRIKPLAIGPLATDEGRDRIEGVSRVLLANLSLLFVPAGVGVVQKLDLVAAHGLAIAVVLVLSVTATLLVTVAAFVVTSRLLSRNERS